MRTVGCDPHMMRPGRLLSKLPNPEFARILHGVPDVVNRYP